MQPVEYRVSVREPYMGNTVPLRILIRTRSDGSIAALIVVNPEGIYYNVEPYQERGDEGG